MRHHLLIKSYLATVKCGVFAIKVVVKKKKVAEVLMDYTGSLDAVS